MKPVSVFILGILCLLLPGSAWSFDFTSRHKQFISELFKQKNYFQCIAETRRLMHYDKKYANNQNVSFFIEANYFLGRQYKSVAAHLLNKKNDFQSSMLLSQALFKLGFHYKAFNILNTFSYSKLSPEDRLQLAFRKADIFLERKAYDGLAKEIALYKKQFPAGSKTKLDSFRDELSASKKLSTRSPAVALMLSVFLPGMGQVYSGKYIAGLLSFASVFGTAYAAYYFRERKQLSATLVFFSSVFYLGNIYGAYNSAARHNQDTYTAFNNSLRKKYIPEYSPVDNVDFLQ